MLLLKEINWIISTFLNARDAQSFSRVSKRVKNDLDLSVVSRVVEQDLHDFSQKVIPTVLTCSTIDLTLTPLVPLEVMHSIFITFTITTTEDNEDVENEEDGPHIQQDDTTPSLVIVLKSGKDDIISDTEFTSIDDAVSSGKAVAKLSFVPQPNTSYHLSYNYSKGEYYQSLVLTDFHVEALIHGHTLAEVFNVFGALGSGNCSGSSEIEWKRGEMILRDGSSLSREIKKMILSFSYSLSTYDIIDGTVLHCAVVGASKSMVDLITEYIGMEACDKGGRSLLHTASACGNIQMAKALIDSYVRKEGHLYSTGLEEAFLTGHVDKEGWSVMHYASHYGKVDAVMNLLEVMGQGAFSFQNHAGSTPLTFASQSGHIDVARLCVEFGSQASIELTDNEGMTALLSAIQTRNINNYDVIKLLIDSGADTNVLDNDGYSAMHHASMTGRLEVIKLLYEVMGQGIFSLQNHTGSTPLTLASQSGHIDVARLCVEFGSQASIELTDNEGMTALLSAIQTRNINNYDVIKLLIDSGADTNVLDNDGYSAMHHASMTGRLEVIKLLYEVMGQGIFSLQNHTGSTLLSFAIENQHYDVARLCVEFGSQASINITDNAGVTALHHASRQANYVFVKLLIDSGANVHNVAYDGRSAMHIAAWNEQLEVVKILAERIGPGAFDLRDESGRTPMIDASMVGAIDIVKFGVEFGTQAMNMADNDGRTPLSYFTFKDEGEDVNIGDVEFLLDSGANVDGSDVHGFTPVI